MSAPPGNGLADDVLNKLTFPIQPRLIKDLREAYSVAAMAANGVDCRLPAAREHAERLAASLDAFSGAPPTLERRNQDQEMFETVANLVSAINCVYVLVCAVASMFRGAPTADRCERFYPDDIAKRLSELYPGESLAQLLSDGANDEVWGALKDLRAVLDHRGTLPRGFRSPGDPNITGIPPQVAYVGSTPRDQARIFPYGWTLDRPNIFRYVEWVEQRVGRILDELPKFAEPRSTTTA